LPTAGAADADFPADLGRVRQQQAAAPSFQAQHAHFRFFPIPDISLRRIARRPNRLTRDEARRMAANFAKLSELLRGPPPKNEV